MSLAYCNVWMLSCHFISIAHVGDVPVAFVECSMELHMIIFYSEQFLSMKRWTNCSLTHELLWLSLMHSITFSFLVSLYSYGCPLAGCYKTAYICVLCQWCKTFSWDLPAVYGEAAAFKCRLFWYPHTASVAQQKESRKRRRSVFVWGVVSLLCSLCFALVIFILLPPKQTLVNDACIYDFPHRQRGNEDPRK